MKNNYEEAVWKFQYFFFSPTEHAVLRMNNECVFESGQWLFSDCEIVRNGGGEGTQRRRPDARRMQSMLIRGASRVVWASTFTTSPDWNEARCVWTAVGRQRLTLGEL